MENPASPPQQAPQVYAPPTSPSPIQEQQHAKQPDGTPYYPPQAPLYPAQQVPPEQQQYYVQPQQAPAGPSTPATYVVASVALAEQPKPEIIKGKGLKSRLPQVPFCCCCFPLHQGSIALAAVTMIFQLVGGILILAGAPLSYGDGLGIALVIAGVLYIVLGIFHGYGVVAISRQDLAMVKRYILGYIICSIVWFVLEISSLAITLSYWNQASGYYGFDGFGFNWGPWIALFLLGIALQVYFLTCLVSYERVLAANVRARAGIAPSVSKDIPLV